MSIIFIQNKYTMWYFDIIKKAKTRTLEKYHQSDHRYIYFERHHIIPKIFGGSNDKNNIINLYPKEHYICHRLLTKMTNGENQKKMSRAMFAMINFNNQYQKNNRYFPCSRTFSLIKENYSKSIKGRPGPNLGKHMTAEAKRKQSKSMLGRTAWNKGKNRTDEDKQKIRDGIKKANPDGKLCWNIGIPVSKETADKIRKANTGKRWIYNPYIFGQRKQLNPDKLSPYLNDGWLMGIGPRKKDLLDTPLP